MPPPSADDPANLDPEDPDFEADEHCPPKLLFASSKKVARRRRRVAKESETDDKSKAKGKGRQTRAPPKEKSEWDTTDEEDNGDDVEEPEVDFPRTPSPRRSPRLARVAPAKAAVAITREVREVRVKEETRVPARAAPKMPEKDRSDPAKRAFGPRDKPAQRVEPPVARAPAPVAAPARRSAPQEDPEENPFL